MLSGRLILLLAAAIGLVLAQGRTTWYATSYSTDLFYSTTRVSYGSVAVTPVPTSSAYSLVTSYVDEPLASSDITVTNWVTVTATAPLATNYVVVYNSSLPSPVVTSSITTSAIWTSPILATITLSATSCANGSSPQTTKTKYTGTYCPLPWQVTTLPKSWPTEVVSIFNDTAVYRRYTYVGTTTTKSVTVTYETYLSTTTLTTTEPTPAGRYPHTTYLTTQTVTSSDWQLEYTTRTISDKSACKPTPTLTRAAACDPTNMISQRDGYGVAIDVYPESWRFPIDFPGEIIGIPGMDASACCQLCLDNDGCAASEWTVGPVNPAACRLYFYGYGNSTCGVGQSLQYYADTWDQPMQGSYIQLGCGSFSYIGVHSDIF